MKERERARKAFSDVARKTCSHTRTQWRKSLTWMIAADQLVGREVSFSKSGFQFPKGAYRVPAESPPSEFASGLRCRRARARGSLRERNVATEHGRMLVLPALFPLDFLSFRDGPSMVPTSLRKFPTGSSCPCFFSSSETRRYFAATCPDEFRAN